MMATLVARANDGRGSDGGEKRGRKIPTFWHLYCKTCSGCFRREGGGYTICVWTIGKGTLYTILQQNAISIKFYCPQPGFFGVARGYARCKCKCNITRTNRKPVKVLHYFRPKSKTWKSKILFWKKSITLRSRRSINEFRGPLHACMTRNNFPPRKTFLLLVPIPSREGDHPTYSTSRMSQEYKAALNTQSCKSALHCGKHVTETRGATVGVNQHTYRHNDRCTSIFEAKCIETPTYFFT